MAMGRNHGASSFYEIRSTNPNKLSTIPDGQFFSEGNGGEFRKSFHGYPNGFAQLLNSPTTFKLQPMQIDTHNRDYHGPGFKAGLLPRSSAAPPNATYSGLLECPCTTRTVKNWTTVYTTATTGMCGLPIVTASECFLAAGRVGPAPKSTTVVSSSTQASGCTVLQQQDGTTTAVFNTMQTGVECGMGSKQFVGHMATLVNMTLALDASVAGGQAMITLIGPSGVWFGVGFNAHLMGDQPYTIVVDGTGAVTERKLGDHDPGRQLSPTQVWLGMCFVFCVLCFYVVLSVVHHCLFILTVLCSPKVAVVSNTVTAGVRTVVLKRAFRGATADHYTFDPTVASVPMIDAVGNSVQLAFHKARGTGTVTMEAVGGATCVCNGGTHGTINGLDFSKNCAPEPIGDLLQQRNPTCFIQTYGSRFCN